MKKAFLALLLVAAYGLVVVRPSWHAVSGTAGGRDFATYHYAWRVAHDGHDPYDKAELSVSQKEEGIRKGGINPYFYPPPFLLTMAWDHVPLPRAYQIYYWMNQAALVGVLLVLWRWLAAPGLLLAGLAITFTPLPDNLRMGQANLLVLLVALIGLWRGNGVALATAAMAKMSPAIYLANWAARRQWQPIVLAVATAIALTLASLPLVGTAAQVRFYTEVLPRFAGGPYHDLTVPITLTANHSIPDLYDQLWPGPDGFTLSAKARLASALTNLGLLSGLMWLARKPRDVLGDAGVLGAFTVLMVITPVYAYEHHLVFLLLPLAVVGTALWRERLPRWVLAPALLVYAFLAHPLGWREPLSRALPALSWFFQEIKFFGAVGLGLLCVGVALASRGAKAAGKAGKAGKKPPKGADPRKKPKRSA